MVKMTMTIKGGFYGLVLLLLTACANNLKPAPVVDGWNKVNSSQRTYTVQPGDTLSSIAWKFAKSDRQLAEYNHLTAPYTVTPGQKLRLTPASQLPEKPAAKVVATAPAKAAAMAKQTPLTETPVKSSETVITGHGQWPWPVKGKVLASFGQNGNKGLDIAVPVGTEVKAVEAGNVVYVGNNLHGYGQLVIIKHNATVMTAYAHNSKLLVKEGSKVTAGQVIALSGDSEAPQAMLHFEVRQAGRPVNPLNFLN